MRRSPRSQSQSHTCEVRFLYCMTFVYSSSWSETRIQVTIYSTPSTGSIHSFISEYYNLSNLLIKVDTNSEHSLAYGLVKYAMQDFRGMRVCMTSEAKNDTTCTSGFFARVTSVWGKSDKKCLCQSAGWRWRGGVAWRPWVVGWVREGRGSLGDHD